MEISTALLKKNITFLKVITPDFGILSILRFHEFSLYVQQIFCIHLQDNCILMVLYDAPRKDVHAATKPLTD